MQYFYPTRQFHLDVEETAREYLIHAELPGVDKKDVDIRLEDNLLTVSAEFLRQKKEETNALWRERHCGRVARRFRLPANVNVEHINAKMENGVLSVSLPKSPEQDNIRQIAVK